jgi:tryptophan 2,3-dioxygenase
MEITPDLTNKIKLLNEKYSAMGQDLNSYLDGLLYADYLTYWDYVQVDTLLSLQHTRTSFPDEKIFILYHQITELYFNLCIHELQQIAEKIENIEVDFFIARMKRVNRYFEALTFSFDINKY